MFWIHFVWFFADRVCRWIWRGRREQNRASDSLTSSLRNRPQRGRLSVSPSMAVINGEVSDVCRGELQCCRPHAGRADKPRAETVPDSPRQKHDPSERRLRPEAAAAAAATPSRRTRCYTGMAKLCYSYIYLSILKKNLSTLRP